MNINIPEYVWPRFYAMADKIECWSFPRRPKVKPGDMIFFKYNGALVGRAKCFSIRHIPQDDPKRPFHVCWDNETFEDTRPKIGDRVKINAWDVDRLEFQYDGEWAKVVEKSETHPEDCFVVEIEDGPDKSLRLNLEWRWLQKELKKLTLQGE